MMNSRAGGHKAWAACGALEPKTIVESKGYSLYASDDWGIGTSGLKRKEALQALERGKFDVVLMDVRMPEMDGLEATRIIRQRWPEKIKIIAITAYALKGDRERCLAAGMDDYISKPVKMGELAEMLSKIQGK